MSYDSTQAQVPLGDDLHIHTGEEPENRSPQVNEIALALAKAQTAFKSAKKDKSNPFFKSRYADLEAVWEACGAALNAEGLAVSQLVNELVHGTVLETMLLHKSGQWLKSTYLVRPVKDDPQGRGSALTYARRYSLAAIAGVVTCENDDDAEAAQGRHPQQKPVQTKPKTDRTTLLPKPIDLPSLLEYKIPMGVHLGKKLSELSLDEVKNSVAAMRKFLDDGVEPDSPVPQMWVNFTAYLKAKEETNG